MNWRWFMDISAGKNNLTKLSYVSELFSVCWAKGGGILLKRSRQAQFLIPQLIQSPSSQHCT